VSQTTGRRRPYAARVPLEERREQLLDAALAVIVRDGYDGVSIDAIAREAGVTRPVVYGAFDGLGVLLTTLLDRQQVRAFGRLLQALPNEPDPTDPTGFVAEAVRRMVAMLREDPDTWRPILLAPEGMPAVVQERIEADRAQVLALFTSMIESVSAANTGPPLDAELLAHAVLAIVEHFGRVLLTDPDRFDAERMVVTVEQLFGMLWR
jgi:AcrR family transcriptional regulator